MRFLPGLARAAICDGHGRALIRGRVVYILPTGSGLFFGAVLMLMLLGSLNYQNNLGLLFTFLTASITLVAMHHTWFNLKGLSVSSQGGLPVFAGEETQFRVFLASSREARRPDLRVFRGSAHGGPQSVEAAGEATVTIKLTPQDRGIFRLGRIRLETRYPLGLFRTWCYVETTARTVVYPRPASRGSPRPPSPSSRQGATGDQSAGADDFLGLRGYRPGDSPRHLDWKAFARERGLVVKQFAGSRTDHVWLDWDRVPAADSETRLSLLCRQVLDASQADQAFGLRLPGRKVAIGQGGRHRRRCLGALALFGQD